MHRPEKGDERRIRFDGDCRGAQGGIGRVEAYERGGNPGGEHPDDENPDRQLNSVPAQDHTDHLAEPGDPVHSDAS